MIDPIFVDLSGNTARIDPQTSAGSHSRMRLSISTEQAYSLDTGEIVARGQALEVYITPDEADALADALRRGRIAS